VQRPEEHARGEENLGGNARKVKMPNCPRCRVHVASLVRPTFAKLI
jgi:hypothetical protein